MFLDNILNYFIFYLPDNMIVKDENLYYYKNNYYTDSLEIKKSNNEFFYVTNNPYFKNFHKTIYINKFKFFKGNNIPTFYNKYEFTIESWNLGIKNFEANTVLFKKGNELSITLLYNLLCRSLHTLEIEHINMNYIQIIKEICLNLNLHFKEKDSSIIIENMININKNKIIELQTFDELILR